VGWAIGPKGALIGGRRPIRHGYRHLCRLPRHFMQIKYHDSEVYGTCSVAVNGEGHANSYSYTSWQEALPCR
jgi:hypothetical protein